MEKKKVVPTWVSVVLLVICAAVLVFNIIDIANNQLGIGYTICLLAETISIILAVFYCLSGYKKSSAVLFKSVVFTRWIASAVALYLQYQSAETSAFTNTSYLLALVFFACLSVFAIAKDIGKPRSITMAIIMICVPVIETIYLIALVGFNPAIFRFLSYILLSIIFLLMVYAKYKDKEARGTK